MITTTKARVAAALGAVAIGAAASLLSLAPASAAGETLTDSNTSYTLGDPNLWKGNDSDGINLSGAGFAPNAELTIELTGMSEDGGGVVDEFTTTADATGAFAHDWFPTNVVAPDAGIQYTVTATDDADPTLTASVDLLVLAPAGISVDPGTISTADLGNQDKGLTFVASGYTPGEVVAVHDVYNGDESDDDLTATADVNGTVAFTYWYTGDLDPGSIDFTLTGQTSGFAQSATVTVTGPSIHVGDAPAATGGGIAPSKKLPVVSG